MALSPGHRRLRHPAGAESTQQPVNRASSSTDLHKRHLFARRHPGCFVDVDHRHFYFSAGICGFTVSPCATPSCRPLRQLTLDLKACAFGSRAPRHRALVEGRHTRSTGRLHTGAGGLRRHSLAHAVKDLTCAEDSMFDQATARLPSMVGSAASSCSLRFDACIRLGQDPESRRQEVNRRFSNTPHNCDLSATSRTFRSSSGAWTRASARRQSREPTWGLPPFACAGYQLAAPAAAPHAWHLFQLTCASAAGLLTLNRERCL